MNDVVFNNEIKVTVFQTPEIPEDGDVVEFLAEPSLLFETDNKTDIENYGFSYTWMVSYDGGLSYKKIGSNTNKLVLENINSKIFNSSIYKVKVILEDLNDFLLTENGDRILTQIGEILLFNNDSSSLSIQSDVVTNDTSISSIKSNADTSITALNFLNVEGTINEALVFDGTITDDIKAEILSLQSRGSITGQEKNISGDVSIDVNLPLSPDPEIVLPSETLSIQSECYVAIKKTFGESPTIQYEVCQPGGSSVLWLNCGDNNPETNDFNNLSECTQSGACDGDLETYCIEGGEIAANIPNIQYNTVDTAGNVINLKFCCDSWDKECDSSAPYDLCEEAYSQELPDDPITDIWGNTYQKYTYQGPCGDKTKCETEEYIPNPRYFVANNCGPTEGWTQSNSNAIVINTAADKRRYCQNRCVGEHVGASFDIGSEVVSPALGVVGIGASIGSAIGGSALVYLGTAGAVTATVATGGLALAVAGLAGLIYTRSYYASGGILSGDIYVNTYCGSDGQSNNTTLGRSEKAIIKECRQKVCKQRWKCTGRTDDTRTTAFSRVLKDGGSRIQVGDNTFIPTDRLITNLNIPYTTHNSAPAYVCDTDGGSISFARKEGTCDWVVTSKCCPAGKKCTWKVSDSFKESNPGTYNEITLDATNKTIRTELLYSINRSKPLDYIETKDSCNAKCSGEGCKVYEKWSILGIEQQTVPCNQDFDVIAYNKIEHEGHGKNGSETTIATDAKCNPDNGEANRIIKIAKIVKRYTYKDPGIEGSYDNVMIQVYRGLGYVPGSRELYFNAYLVKYEEQSVGLPEVQLQIGAIDPTDSPYIKTVKTFNKEKLYRHSAILMTESLSLNRNCHQCSPIYIVSKPSPLEYPCNDRNYVISACVDESNNPLPAAYGECLKDSSDKTTPIKIVTITEIKEPTTEMLRLADAPNTDYFKNLGAAKAEGLRRVGSTGIVCSGPSI